MINEPSVFEPSKFYCSSVSDPQSIVLQDELEKVQKRTVIFVTISANTPMKLVV